MQIQLNISHKKLIQDQKYSCQQSLNKDTLDFTLKAYFIFIQLKQTDYTFNKKSLVMYLNGKAISLKQKGDERPPSNLKKYMSLESQQQIVQMLNIMVTKQILIQQQITINNRHTKRITPNNMYDLKKFPKIILVTSRILKLKSLSKSSSRKKQTDRRKNQSDEINKQSDGKKNQTDKITENIQSLKKQSRLSWFLTQKANLPVNVQKRDMYIQLRFRQQKEREILKEKALEEQVKREAQEKQNQQKQRISRYEQQLKARTQKQIQQQYMHTFWLKQRYKLIESVCHKKDIPSLYMPSLKPNYKKQKPMNPQTLLQTAGNMLQIQMKELKQNQDIKKNHIHPLFSWSFIKNTLGIDNSQGQNQIIRNRNKDKRLDSIKLETQTNQLFGSDFKEKEDIWSQKQEISPKTNTKPKVDHVSQSATPFILRRQLPIMQIQGSFQENFYHQSKPFQYTDDCTSAVTRTNIKLFKQNRDQKIENLNEKKQRVSERQQVFASSKSQSMFNTPYYKNTRKSTQTVTNMRKGDENVSNKYTRELFQKNVMNFTFKRESPAVVQDDAVQQTMTLTKKLRRTSSYQELSYYQDKSKEEDIKLPTDKYLINRETERTRTFAVSRLSKKTHNTAFRPSIRESSRILKDRTQSINIEMFSQTLTTPEPRTKNKKTGTQEIEVQAGFMPLKRQIKRHSFVQELIASVCYKRLE